MKRNAFNMLELIFVIIILGILSAVVAVKMSNMTKYAKEAQLKSFTGTLNRSVGPAIWFKSLGDDRGGSVAFADYDADLGLYVELIPGYTSAPALMNCNNTGDGIFVTYLFGKNYQVHCADGNITTSPLFRLYNETDHLYLD